jgi:hypothetical protein
MEEVKISLIIICKMIIGKKLENQVLCKLIDCMLTIYKHNLYEYAYHLSNSFVDLFQILSKINFTVKFLNTIRKENVNLRLILVIRKHEIFLSLLLIEIYDI